MLCSIELYIIQACLLSEMIIDCPWPPKMGVDGDTFIKKGFCCWQRAVPDHLPAHWDLLELIDFINEEIVITEPRQ